MFMPLFRTYVIPANKNILYLFLALHIQSNNPHWSDGNLCNCTMMMWSYLLMTAGCCYLYDDHFMSINANMISYLPVRRALAARTQSSFKVSIILKLGFYWACNLLKRWGKDIFYLVNCLLVWKDLIRCGDVLNPWSFWCLIINETNLS